MAINANWNNSDEQVLNPRRCYLKHLVRELQTCKPNCCWKNTGRPVSDSYRTINRAARTTLEFFKGDWNEHWLQENLYSILTSSWQYRCIQFLNEICLLRKVIPETKVYEQRSKERTQPYRCIQFLNIVINPTKYQNHNRFLEGNKKLKEQSKTIEISNLFHELIWISYEGTLSETCAIRQSIFMASAWVVYRQNTSNIFTNIR